MRNTCEPERLEELLQRLAEGNAPLDLRQEAAEALTDAIGRMPLAPTWLDVLHKMVADQAPEVRRAVAYALPHLPDAAFSALAGRLADDLNQYVRDTVAKAVEERGLKQRQNRNRRKKVADLQERYRAFEAAYGAPAARRARRIGDQMFDALVGGTLHDMIGILAPMRVDLELMLRHFESGTPSRASCRTKATKFLQQINYLQTFLDDMRTYTRVKDKKRSRTSVGELAQQALALAREGLQAAGLDTEAVIVEVDAPETLRVSLYPHMATTALMNLIRNGLEALAEATVAGEKRLSVRACSDGAGGVRISVEDNGPGLYPELLQELKASSLGITTKKGRGTGFGVPTANRFAEAHGGRLEIDSRQGTGAVFTLLLPAAKEADE